MWSKVLVLIVTSFVARTKKCYGVPSPALLYYKYCLFFFILSIRPCPRHSSLSFQSVLILVPCFTFGIRPGVHSSLSSQYILVSFYLSFNPSFYYSPHFFFLSFLSVLFLARASFLSFQFVQLYSSLFSFFIISSALLLAPVLSFESVPISSSLFSQSVLASVYPFNPSYS